MFQPLCSFNSSDASSFAAAGLRRSQAHYFSLVAEEESPSTNSVISDSRLLPPKNSNPTMPNLPVDDKSFSLAGTEGTSSRHLSTAVEEESTTPNSVSVDSASPVLPPKGLKLSQSLVLVGDKLTSPPVIPRRLSVPHSSQAVAVALPSDDGGASLTVETLPQGPTSADQEPPKQSAVNGRTDSPTEVGRDIAPTLLPRWPIPQVKRRLRVVPKPAENPMDSAVHLDSSEASVQPKVTLPEGCSPDTGTGSGRISPESEMKPVAAAGVHDDDLAEVSTARKPVSEMKRDIESRMSAVANVPPGINTKPVVPARKPVISAAFQNSTAS